jgi:hypothetical protein
MKTLSIILLLALLLSANSAHGTTASGSTLLSQENRDLRALEQMVIGLFSDITPVTANATVIPGLGVYINTRPVRPHIAGLDNSFSWSEAERLISEFFTDFLANITTIHGDDQVLVHLHFGRSASVSVPGVAVAHASQTNALMMQASRNQINQRGAASIHTQRLTEETQNRSDQIFVRILSSVLADEGVNPAMISANSFRLQNGDPLFSLNIAHRPARIVQRNRVSGFATQQNYDNTQVRVRVVGRDTVHLNNFPNFISPEEIQSIEIRTDSIMRMVDIRLRDAEENMIESNRRLAGVRSTAIQADSLVARAHVARISLDSLKATQPTVVAFEVLNSTIIDWDSLSTTLSELLVQYGNTLQRVPDSATIHLILNPNGIGSVSSEISTRVLQIRKSDLTAFQRGSISLDEALNNVHVSVD